MTNFTKKQLTLIAEYYGLNKRNLNKEIVQIISIYETDQSNIENVCKRKMF